MTTEVAQWGLVQIATKGPVFRGLVPVAVIREELTSGKVAWTDLVFAAGKTLTWTRICDLDDFRSVFPPAPDPLKLEECKRACKASLPEAGSLPQEIEIEGSFPELENTGGITKEEPSTGTRNADWYFQFHGSEYGPVTRSQLQGLLEKEKADGQLYVWRQGLQSWVLVKTMQEFAQLIGAQEAGKAPLAPPKPANSPPPQSQSNLRAHPRHALVATVFLIIGSKWKRTVGVCADISLTGLQIVTDGEAEFSLGQEYEFEIHPAPSQGVQTFHAHAKAVWLKAAERRAGFAFVRMTPADQQGLVKCLSLKPPAP